MSMREKLRMSDTCAAQVERQRSLIDPLGGFNGYYKVDHWRRGKLLYLDEGPNTIQWEGKKYLLTAGLAGGTVKTPWYVRLVANTTPPDHTLATWIHDTFFDTQAVEVTGYSGGTGKEFVETVTTGPPPTISNPAPNRASFTFTGSYTLYGAVLASEASGHADTGYLMSYRAFNNPIGVITDDVVNVEIALSW